MTTTGESATDATPGHREAPEKRVSWVELFFDLVYVVAITQVSGLLEADHSPLGLLRALIVFVPIYFVWVGAAVQTNQNDAAQPRIQFLLFAIALGGLFMALGVPSTFADGALILAVAYWATRMVLFLAQRSWRFSLLNPVALSVVATGPLLVVGALLPPAARTAVWAVAALLDLGSLLLFRRTLRRMRFDAGHLTERFGSFVLIALGESIVAVSVSALHGGHLTVGSGLAVVAGFALICGLWWVYFHFAIDAMKYALATADVQLNITRRVLSYGHLGFIAAIIAISFGLHETVAQPLEHSGWTATVLLFGGVAVYLAVFVYTRWAMFRQVSSTRLTAAGATLLLLPLGAVLPALGSLAVLALALTALNIVEYRIIKARAA